MKPFVGSNATPASHALRVKENSFLGKFVYVNRASF
jgi:hypothetical protein